MLKCIKILHFALHMTYTRKGEKGYKCRTIHKSHVKKEQQSVCVKLLNRFQAPSEHGKKKRIYKKLVIQDFIILYL